MAIRYVSLYSDMPKIPSNFVGVARLVVECQAKIVNRQSLQNSSVGVSNHYDCLGDFGR